MPGTFMQFHYIFATMRYIPLFSILQMRKKLFKIKNLFKATHPDKQDSSP